MYACARVCFVTRTYDHTKNLKRYGKINCRAPQEKNHTFSICFVSEETPHLGGSTHLWCKEKNDFQNKIQQTHTRTPTHAHTNSLSQIYTHAHAHAYTGFGRPLCVYKGKIDTLSIFCSSASSPIRSDSSFATCVGERVCV